MNKTHFYPDDLCLQLEVWRQASAWDPVLLLALFWWAKLMGNAWSYGRVISWAIWILMRTGTVQEGIFRDQNLYQPLILALLQNYGTNSPRDQTPDYGWQGSFGGAWFYMVLCCCRAWRSSYLRIWWSWKVWEFSCSMPRLWNSCIDLQYYQLINYVQLRQHSQRWRELCTSFRFWLPYAIQKKRLYIAVFLV